MSTSTSSSDVHEVTDSRLSRRGFLRGAAATGGGLVAVAVAACTPGGTADWSFHPPASIGTGGSPEPSASAAASAGASASPAASMDHSPSPSASASGSPGPSPSPAPSTPAGWSEHDLEAKAKVDRFLAGEYDQIPEIPNVPLEPEIDGDTKVFRLTIDEIPGHRVDAVSDPVAAIGYGGTWPGPLIRVVEGDRIRAIFTNNLPETTGVHFHGQSLPNPVDGVPMVTQDPIVPGGEWTYEFVASPAGSHMYHSHHNATDQVGRGLLGAFIVDPQQPADRPADKYGTTQDLVWISNDQLGGFTINGRQFPATYPIVANLGERIYIRFMNEGVMMHPWHLHGMPMRVVARDGYDLGSAAFTCDTIGVNPGERWDVVVDCDNPGVWAFHCHILPHAEAMTGMFGMVTALIVNDAATAALVPAATGVEVVEAAVLSARSLSRSTTICSIPSTV